MADAAPPRPDPRLDRTTTPLRGPVQRNMPLALALFGTVLLAGLWMLLGGREDEVGPTGRPQAVEPAEPSVIPVPRPAEPPAPPAQPPPPPPPAPPAVPPAVDPMAEQRARLLLARIQRLQKELDDRRRSKILVVSHTPRPSPPVLAAGPGGDGPPPPTTTALADATGTGVGPRPETAAVQARLLPTTGYTITEGTVIAGVLETAINSDLPGMVRALTAADVYGHDGTELLIPKGSRLVGRYQSDIRRGQVRIFILWNRILRADGTSILINSPGTDPLGRGGLEGDVDTHFLRIFGAAVLLSILDGGLEVAVEAARGSGDRTTIIQNDSGLNRAGEIALHDALRIQPTIHVDQGTRISILVARDLDFRAVEQEQGDG